jgi:hypothetical protein
VARGTCYALFAFEVARAIDLETAERRILAATRRQTIKQRRRAPPYFEYRPAPLRVALEAPPLKVGSHYTSPTVELVLYDFGAVSVAYAIPIQGPLAALPELGAAVAGNEALLADSRRMADQVVRTIHDAATRPVLADVVEDYTIFAIESLTEPQAAAELASTQSPLIARILRAEPHALSPQEIAEATTHRLSFGLDDVTFIETDVTLMFDAEGEDVRAVIEFANTQLLEMRYLDRQLDGALDRAYDVVSRRRRRLLPVRYDRPLRQLAELQLDSASLFEQVTNALKLIGEQYLTRVYKVVSRRFHLADWDASITRKLAVLDGIYAKVTDQATTRRMEVLEWIIILLIALEMVLPLGR